jgi:hypothetical protein
LFASAVELPTVRPRAREIAVAAERDAFTVVGCEFDFLPILVEAAQPDIQPTLKGLR